MEYNNRKVTQRILQFAQHLEMKDSELALEVNILKQNIQKLRKGQSNIPEAKVLQFLNLHRELNSDWLLFGDGDMYSNSGVYKATFNIDGEANFEADLTSNTNSEEELEKLKAILSEKETHIKTLKESVEILNNHIGRLIEKI